MQKYRWKTYGEIQRAAESELWEALALDSSEAQIALLEEIMKRAYVMRSDGNIRGL